MSTLNGLRIDTRDKEAIGAAETDIADQTLRGLQIDGEVLRDAMLQPRVDRRSATVSVAQDRRRNSGYAARDQYHQHARRPLQSHMVWFIAEHAVVGVEHAVAVEEIRADEAGEQSVADRRQQKKSTKKALPTACLRAVSRPVLARSWT